MKTKLTPEQKKMISKVDQNMNLLFWKHKEKGHIIKNDCLNKLPAPRRSEYYQTTQTPTHTVEPDNSDDGFLLSMIAMDAAQSSADVSQTDNYNAADYSAPAEDHSGQGGDFGGGGSSGSWDSSSNDTGTGYDSGSSSYDSGSSSYDSGSSSYDSSSNDTGTGYDSGSSGSFDSGSSY